LKSLALSLPTILVSRRPRQIGVGWSGARSWFGGAPRIGAAPWPRNTKREPLHFMAQIDLAEVAAKAGKTAMPDKGSLAFFVGGEAAVVFVPEGQSDAPVMPPAGTPDLTEYGGSSDWRTDLAGQPLYPYWPVDFAALDVPLPPSDDDYEAVEAFHAAEVAAVEKLFPRRKYYLSPDQAFAGPPIPDWWQNAIQLSSDLARASRDGQGALSHWRMKREQARAKGGKELEVAEAAVAKLEEELAKLHEAKPTFKDYVAEVVEWTAGRDPWALMSAEELEQLAVYWKRNTAFPDLTGYRGIGELDWLKEKMLKALPAAGSAAYTDLPAQVRSLVDAHRASRPQWWFTAIQYAARLQEATRLGVPAAMKYRQDNVAVYRKLLDKLQPTDALAAFRRMLGPKRADATKLEADIAKAEAKLAELRRLEPVFRTFVQETSDWTKARDPWSPMRPADIEQLDGQMKRVREEFKDFDAYVPHRREELETSTLLAMASADERGYAALPEPVQKLINRNYLLPSGGWHQMFGRGIEIQGDSCAMREEGYIMLLQLTYDDLMHWSFGDNGCYQFWISPADLVQRNWAGVKMTLECH
jgi:cell division protein FtsB